MAKITLAVSSSISSYKSLDLLSALQKQGHLVAPILSNTTKRWLSPILFNAMVTSTSGFSTIGLQKKGMPHIDLGKQSDLIVYAPATANTLCNLAQGRASDVLSALFLVARCPIIICPAMNPLMWRHPNVQKNVRILSELGAFLCGPDIGPSACQDWGVGKLISVENILSQIQLVLSSKKKQTPFTNTSILITSGGSQEPIDPVRVLSNISSGTMGSFLAQQAIQLGAKVTYLQGRVLVPPPAGPRIVSFTNNQELQTMLQEELPHHEILIMCASPCDWKSGSPSPTKLSRTKNLIVHFEKLPDILSSLSKKSHQIFIGFALENTLDVTPSVLTKIKEKQLDLLVINAIDTIGKPMTNIRILTSTGDCAWESKTPISKQQAARHIFEVIQTIVDHPCESR